MEELEERIAPLAANHNETLPADLEDTIPIDRPRLAICRSNAARCADA